MPSILGPAGDWELVSHARRPWIYLLRALYGVALLSVLAIRWPEHFQSINELASIGFAKSMGLLLTHLVVVYFFTPLLVLDAFLKTKRPGRIELLLSTPLSSREIVWSTLGARLLGVTALSAGILPALAIVGLFGGVDYWRLLFAAILTPFTLLYCGALAVFCGASSRTFASSARRCYLLLLLLTPLPGASPLFLWVVLLNGFPDLLSIVFGCGLLAGSTMIAVFWMRKTEALLDEFRTSVRPEQREEFDGRQASWLDELEWGVLRSIGPFLLVAFAPVVLLVTLPFSAPGGSIGMGFLLSLATAIAAFEFVGGLILVLRGACHNPWLDRFEGQGLLLLTTAMGNARILWTLVVCRRLVGVGVRCILIGTLLLSMTPGAALVAGGVWLAFTFHLVAVGASLLLIGEPSRRAAAWTFGTAFFECALPFLAPDFSSAMFRPVGAAVLFLFLLFGRRTSLSVVLFHMLLFLLIAGAWLEPPSMRGDVFDQRGSQLSPLYWVGRIVSERYSETIGRLTAPAEAVSYFLGAAAACVASWAWLLWRFDWLIDRPRRRWGWSRPAIRASATTRKRVVQDARTSLASSIIR